ncbi:TPA: helix-turn-helix domain-containing protein [Klebsiella variicola]
MNRNYHPQHCKYVPIELRADSPRAISVKAALALKLNELIDQRRLNQTEVATITGMSQPKVSQVRRYKLLNISLERLMLALVSLDQHVEIVVQPAQKPQKAELTVIA